MTGFLDRLAVVLGSVLYLGYAPLASGTVGTLAGIPLVLAVVPAGLGGHLAALAAVTVAGIWAAGRCDRVFEVHDSSRIVVDEVAGYLVATILVPPTVGWLTAAFLLFRLFDVLKPFPAGWIDRHMHGGTGVMLDDLVAGGYTLLVLHAALLIRG